MSFRRLSQFLSESIHLIPKGPIALILIEDDAVITQTLAHHLRAGFKLVLAVSSKPLADRLIPKGGAERIINVQYDCRGSNSHVQAVNATIDAVPPGTWLYYCFNAEFLYYPFSEHRTVGEMLAFHAEERRHAMLTYVIDLYASDLARFPDAISIEHAMFDRAGYFALNRTDRDGTHKERQLNFYGGLRWRFEEHIPNDYRNISRIALFRTQSGLRLLPDHHFNMDEYNTYSCPWHHNLTAAVASFRVAKALVKNPGSRRAINDFRWRNSHSFDWSSQQLMDLGLMEPGQWF